MTTVIRIVELEYKIPKTDEASSIVIEFESASIATLLLGLKLECMLLYLERGI